VTFAWTICSATKFGRSFSANNTDCQLWIVLSDPTIDPEHVVIVNFTTHTVNEEQCCVVDKGEHPLVRHKTAVRYWDAKTVTANHLDKLVTSR
jgi:hypothetical protein